MRLARAHRPAIDRPGDGAEVAGRAGFRGQGGGPTLIEAKTYRWKGHSKSDKNLYRSREEIDDWKSRDPIGRFEATLEDAATLTAQEIEGARTTARDAVREAIRRASAAPDARADELVDAVYA